MDSLSRLLSLHPVQTALDNRCRLSAPWQMNRAAKPYGVAPYHLVVEGRARVDIPGHPPLDLMAGDMLVLPRGQAHRLYIPDGHDGADLRTVSDAVTVTHIDNDDARPATDVLCGEFRFGETSSNTLIGALPDVLLVRTGDRQEFRGLKALVSLLRDEASELRPGASTVVSHLASALFSLLLRAWLAQASGVSGVFALLTDPRLKQALHDMLAEPATPWTLEKLAERCHMSRSTFVRAFRAVSGTTPADLLMRVRMAQAAQRLRQTHLEIAEIGEAAGYMSEAAFNRAFKRYMGVGPGRYRRCEDRGQTPMPVPSAYFSVAKYSNAATGSASPILEAHSHPPCA